MKHFLALAALACTCLCGLSGCSSEVEDYYAHERAFLRFTPVTAIHPLYTALSNPGMFCQVTISTATYDFAGADGTKASYPLTALEAYGKPECVAGFVVGTPSVYDLNMQQKPVAYDLVCPSCYEENMIQRSLSFSGSEEMSCPRCKRVYDLTNGLLKKGEGGVKQLYRYRITYAPANDLVVVMN